jgi:hypothetical protein
MIVLLLALSAAGPAPAQPSAASRTQPVPGQKLKDGRGVPVGEIEKVIYGPDGRALQVLARVTRVLHALPVSALTPAGDGYATVLSRAELESLPPAN